MLNTNAKKIDKSKTLISLRNVTKTYDDFAVLKNISFAIHGKEKIGLVGPNGIGKSTLLKIIVGEVGSYAGNIEKYRKARIGYIPQEAFGSNKGSQKVVDFLKEHTGMNESEIKTSTQPFIHKLQLKENILDSSIGELSGGERGKISIVRIMIAPFDVFLLDEPTNNLDLKTLYFIENFIKKSKKAFLIVSHDREFLDRVVKKIVDIDENTRESSIYNGNFSNYAKERKRKIEQEWARFKDSQEKIVKLDRAMQKRVTGMEKIDQAFKDKKKLGHKITDKNHLKKEILHRKAGKAGKQAKVFEERLSRLREDAPLKPKRKLPLKIKFEIEKVSGNKVFDVSEVVWRLNSFKIGPIDISIKKGERILFLGQNGAGKTTLLKMLLGEIVPGNGVIEVGEGVSIGYLPQMRDVDLNLTVKEQLMQYADLEESDARKLLNRFGIGKDDINKKINEISPGEYSRLLLALTMAQKANCLILDEPSNHLDLEVLEELEVALKDFDGTLVLVSHDRRFIDSMKITKTYLLEEGILKEINDYHKYGKSL